MWACVCLLSLCVSIKYNEKDAEEKEGFFLYLLPAHYKQEKMILNFLLL